MNNDDFESIQFAREEKFSKKEKKRNAYTFRSLSLDEYPFREIFESNVEGIKVNSFTEREREKERQNRFFSTHSKTWRRGERRRSKGSICRSDFTSGIEWRERKETRQQCCFSRFVFWPALLYLDAAKTDESTSEEFVEQARSFPHPTKHIFPRFSPRLSSQVPRFRSIFQASEKTKRGQFATRIVLFLIPESPIPFNIPCPSLRNFFYNFRTIFDDDKFTPVSRAFVT